MHLQRKTYSKGFTLIEILLVMVIIAVIATLASLSIKSINHLDERQVWLRSFQQNLEYAMDLSVLSKNDYAIKFKLKALDFLQREDQAWVASKNDILSSMSYPNASVINLYIEGDKRLLGNSQAIDVQINQSFGLTPFEFQLTSADKMHILKTDPLGKIDVSQRK